MADLGWTKHIADTEERETRKEKVVIRNSELGGTYIAEMQAVKAKLAQATKRELVKECIDMWPELLRRNGGWSRALLQDQPSFVLAVVLTQCD